jgi:hypothetical protein
MDGPSPLLSNGLPYVFTSFESQGPVEIICSLVDQVIFRPTAEAGLEVELLAQNSNEDSPVSGAVHDEFARSVKVVAGGTIRTYSFKAGAATLYQLERSQWSGTSRPCLSLMRRGECGLNGAGRRSPRC